MHLNKLHGILRRAGLKPFAPARGNRVGYCIYTEQLPFDPVRHVCVYFRSTKPWEPWERLRLEQAQEAAIAALSAAGLTVEATETIAGWPAVEFAVTNKAYRYFKQTLTTKPEDL